MLRITILLVTFIIIQLFNNLIFADSNKQLKIEDNIIIKNESDAVNRALEFSGFDKLKDFDIEKAKGKVELMIARDSTTPFLADSINGKIAWSIEFKDVILDLDQTTYEQEIANPLSFVILIDAESGRLLRFESIHTELIIPSHKVVPIKVAEYQLAINGSEMYHSLPLIIPSLSFYEAIKSNKLHGNPFIAKQTEIQYFIYSNRALGDKIIEKPVWVITYYGLPPFRNNITHMRHVVDINSNKRVFSINMPRNMKLTPELKKKMGIK